MEMKSGPGVGLSRMRRITLGGFGFGVEFG